MTRTIRVSDATYRLIMSLAVAAFRSTGTRQQDGSWQIPVDDEVFSELRRRQFPGESDDDTMVRIIHCGDGPGLN